MGSSHTPPSPAPGAGDSAGSILERGRGSLEHRLLPPGSPAQQKSPFDLSTPGAVPGAGAGAGAGRYTSAFTAQQQRTSSVISRPGPIKQEPGSPGARLGAGGSPGQRAANLSPPPKVSNVSIVELETKVCKDFNITEKALTRAFCLLKAPTTVLCSPWVGG